VEAPITDWLQEAYEQSDLLTLKGRQAGKKRVSSKKSLKKKRGKK
jgi:hypothetical protein